MTEHARNCFIASLIIIAVASATTYLHGFDLSEMLATTVLISASSGVGLWHALKRDRVDEALKRSKNREFRLAARYGLVRAGFIDWDGKRNWGIEDVVIDGLTETVFVLVRTRSGLIASYNYKVSNPLFNHPGITAELVASDPTGLPASYRTVQTDAQSK